MIFNSQPILNGQLLMLRPMRDEDAEALYALASDPLLWELHPEKDRYKREVFARFIQSAMDSKGALVAIDKKTGEIIGSSRYYGFHSQISEVTIGYSFLAKAFWGGVYNFEMKTLMLDHAYQAINTVTFFIGSANLRSRRAVEKLGATLREQQQETVVYELTKSNWLFTKQKKHEARY